MLLTFAAAVILMQGDSARPPRRFVVQHAETADSAAMASAYADDGAAELVRLARQRREVEDRSVLGYRTLAKEQISLGIRALGRDRMVYRREMAARVDWRRDGLRHIEVVGAREAIPIAIPGVQLPDDMRQDVRDLAFDPADNQLQMGLNDSSFVRHPLAPGSETDYRFASGDTTRLEFPDGRVVQLIELKITPRRDEFRLISGSLWVDRSTHAVVRAVFRPARPFNLETDLHQIDNNPRNGDPVDKIPGMFKPITAEVRVVTIEYGLWHVGWWMPRLMLFDGVASAGSFLHLPMRYERVYSEYDVWAVGDTIGWAPIPRPAALAIDATVPDSLARTRAGVRVCAGPNCRRPPPRRRRVLCSSDGVEFVPDSVRVDSTVTDSTPRPRLRRCTNTFVTVPDDTMALLTSPTLPGSIFAQDEALVSESDLKALEERLELIPEAPWKLHPPTWAIGLGGSGLVRYDRVEALSVAGRTTFDLGRLSLDATARIGIGDLTPNGELGLTHDALNTTSRLAAYRRLAVADPETRALGFGSTLSAFFLGRDDGDYFRTLGVELSQAPAPTLPQYATWRVYAEHQRAATKTTDISLPRLFDTTRTFRPNIVADSADQIGVAVTVHGARGLNPDGVRWSWDFAMDGSAGTFAFGRVALVQRLMTPLPWGLSGGIEAGAGSSGGAVPVQSLFYLGGAATLRGFGGATASGTSYWRGRVDIATSLPAARLVTFSDVGWAGPRDVFTLKDPYWSVGVGASFLDGLLRLDLAKGVRRQTGWRVEMYVGGTL